MAMVLQCKDNDKIPLASWRSINEDVDGVTTLLVPEISKHTCQTLRDRSVIREDESPSMVVFSRCCCLSKPKVTAPGRL